MRLILPLLSNAYLNKSVSPHHPIIFTVRIVASLLVILQNSVAVGWPKLLKGRGRPVRNAHLRYHQRSGPNQLADDVQCHC